MISVIIPTHKNPAVLDLCLKSAISGQERINDILVVVDGTYEVNKKILEKYSRYINLIIFESNQGMCKAQNVGVSQAKYSNILIVNDDNLFPQQWDSILSSFDISNSVIAPNQIEPYQSIFKGYHIKDLGRNPENFDLDNYWSYEQTIRKNLIEDTGRSYPIYIDKYNYLQCGGFDIEYPTSSGTVADCDFFLKCELRGLKMLRIYHCMFYHFVSTTRKTTEAIIKNQQIENQCKIFFKNKWGQLPQFDFTNNSRLLTK